MPSFLLWKPYGGFSLADLSPFGFKAVASDPAYIAADCFSIPPLHTAPTSSGILLHPTAQVLVSAISVRVRERGVCRLCLVLADFCFVLLSTWHACSRRCGHWAILSCVGCVAILFLFRCSCVERLRCRPRELQPSFPEADQFTRTAAVLYNGVSVVYLWPTSLLLYSSHV